MRSAPWRDIIGCLILGALLGALADIIVRSIFP